MQGGHNFPVNSQARAYYSMFGVLQNAGERNRPGLVADFMTVIGERRSGIPGMVWEFLSREAERRMDKRRGEESWEEESLEGKKGGEKLGDSTPKNSWLQFKMQFTRWMMDHRQEEEAGHATTSRST